MKVGSIVKCIKLGGYDSDPTVECPKIGSTYTVRGIYESPLGKYKKSIYLEEIKNGPNIFGVEPSFYMPSFRELLPPEECSLEELMEELEEDYA